MAYIPTHCDDCARSALVDARSITDSFAVCAACGAGARVVPGSSFRREDVAPYQSLADAVKNAAIDPLNAEQLTETISYANYAVPGPLLRHLAKTYPALAFLELTEAGGANAVRKLEAMLMTLLRGLSSGHHQSGFVLAAGVEPSRAKG